MTPIRPEKLPEGMEGEIQPQMLPPILSVKMMLFNSDHVFKMARIGWIFAGAAAITTNRILVSFYWHPTPEMTNEKP